MWKRLGLGLLLVACSSEPGSMSDDGGASGSGGGAGLVAGESGATTASAAGTHAAVAGSPATAGSGGDDVVNSGGLAGEAAEAGGMAGASGGSVGGTVAGAGPSGGSGGSASTGGSDAGEAGGAGGVGGSTSTGGSGNAGAPAVDACANKPHWSPTDKGPDYDLDEQRVFGGYLWRCHSPALCPTYPGHESSPGWLKVETCLGGPIAEVAPCQCAAGSCCDGCYLRPRSYFCGEFVRTAQCLGATVNQCGGGTDTIDKDYWNLFCDGASSGECTRWGAHTKYSNGDCPGNTGCLEQGDQASCVACN